MCYSIVKIVICPLVSQNTIIHAWFPPDMMLRTEAEQFHLGFIRPENLIFQPLAKSSFPFYSAVLDHTDRSEWLPDHLCKRVSRQRLEP